MIVYKVQLQQANSFKIGHLNINSLRNKFEVFKSLIQGNIDIFVSETKLDVSFPRSQFTIDGFSTPFRLGRNDERGNNLLR